MFDVNWHNVDNHYLTLPFHSNNFLTNVTFFACFYLYNMHVLWLLLLDVFNIQNNYVIITVM